MANEDRDDDRTRHNKLDIRFWGLDGATVLDDLGRDLWTWIDGTTPDPAAIEETLSELSLPDGTDLDIDTEVLPDAGLNGEEIDQVVETGGEAVEVAVEGTGEAGKVFVDTGSEVIEVAVEGGDAAAEVTGELIVAALEGV